MSMIDSGTVAQTLAFLKSVIQCGEPWTNECQEAYDAALKSLESLRGDEWSAHGPY